MLALNSGSYLAAASARRARGLQQQPRRAFDAQQQSGSRDYQSKAWLGYKGDAARPIEALQQGGDALPQRRPLRLVEAAPR